MAKKDDPTEWIVLNPRGYLSHYSNLVDHYRTSLTTSGKIYSIVEALMMTQEGLPQLEHELTRLKESIERSRTGDIVDPGWISVLGKMSETMQQIWDKRQRIKELTATLMEERKILGRLNSYLENYLLEERQPEDGSGE